MEMTKNFQTAAIGGFKKDEVLSYIDALVQENSREKSELEAKISEQDAKIAALNAIADEQVQKIASLSKENQSLQSAHTALKSEYEPYRQARIRADEIEKKSLDFARATEEKLRDLLADAQTRADQIVNQAKKEAGQIRAEAHGEAERILSSVKKEEFLLRQNAQEALDEAKTEAHRQVTEAAQKGRELLDETERTVSARISAAEQKLTEAQNVLDEAQAKGTEIVKNAQLAARCERDRYEHGLESLEMQKSELLRTLDEIKLAVQAVSLSRDQAADEQIAEQSRRSTVDALRKRIAELNQKTKADRRL